MKSDHWMQILDLFHEALQLTDNERVNFLESVGKRQPVLVNELRELLQSHFDSGSFLTGTATDKIMDPDEPF